MARVPKDPRDIFPSVVDDYKGVFSDGLVSIIVYGSTACGEYVAGTSDINLMIVVSEDRIDFLEQAFGVIKKWRKHNVATPLLLTEDYVRTSLDVFPIEYLNFQNCHEVVYGKDILDELTFDPYLLRLQCEREIKGKLLLLREGFLETRGKGRYIQELISDSLHAFIAIFNGLLHLKGKELPRNGRDVVTEICATFGLDSVVFERLLDIKAKRIKPSAKELTELFKSYLKEVRRLWKVVDTLEIGT
ncbi:MAG: hypothetical protein JRD47_03145 [Deltaproteobacteria bacterium]|nr:hypothetical protein [Deltaproteobacteria bacterium]MBW2265394.1 hypothetical protein [Deltaproteobacteria bacterium]MBW2318126.1 hypothetical protein [Deltaproteobacteria bacterium]MBW2600917.1 hypothetical protein [Deltaproteobacteria bacterium]